MRSRVALKFGLTFHRPAADRRAVLKLAAAMSRGATRKSAA